MAASQADPPQLLGVNPKFVAGECLDSALRATHEFGRKPARRGLVHAARLVDQHQFLNLFSRRSGYFIFFYIYLLLVKLA